MGKIFEIEKYLEEINNPNENKKTPLRENIKQVNNDSPQELKTEVAVNKAFRIGLFSEDYSTDPGIIGDNREISYIYKQTNEYYLEHFGEIDSTDATLREPYSAPRCLVINTGYRLEDIQAFAFQKMLGAKIDIKNQGIKNQVKNVIGSVLGGDAKFVRDDEDIITAYKKLGDSQFPIVIIGGNKIFVGQLWINDNPSAEENEKTVRQWLESVRPYRKKAGNVKKEIHFGKYRQGDDDKEEPIVWQVLKEEDDRMLIITKDCIEKRRLFKDAPEYSWKTSDLRSWLNTTFLFTAFTEAEQKKILPVEYPGEIKNKKEYMPTAGTVDKVTILSLGEVKTLLKNNKEKKSLLSKRLLTEETKNAIVYFGEGTGNWWTRTSLDKSHNAVITEEGRTYQAANEWTGEICLHCVRPVMWIKK